MSELCDLPVKVPCYYLQSEQERPRYGWRHVGLLDVVQIIWRAKKDGGNSYRELVVLVLQYVVRPSVGPEIRSSGALVASVT